MKGPSLFYLNFISDCTDYGIDIDPLKYCPMEALAGKCYTDPECMAMRCPMSCDYCIDPSGPSKNPLFILVQEQLFFLKLMAAGQPGRLSEISRPALVTTHYPRVME